MSPKRPDDLRARPAKSHRDPMSAGDGARPVSRGAPPPPPATVASDEDDDEGEEGDEGDEEEEEEDDDDENGNENENENENETTICPERSERAPPPSRSMTTSGVGTPSEAGGMERSSISTAAGGARKSSTGLKKGPKSNLPPEKVFPIQIGSQLFRLSGASIVSDGQYCGLPSSPASAKFLEHRRIFPNSSKNSFVNKPKTAATFEPCTSTAIP
jgi:hypothetical protein